MVLLGHSYWGYTALKREKWPIFGAPRLKKGPHRRFGGSKFVADFWFWNFDKKRSFPFFRFVSNIFIQKVIHPGQNFTNPFLTKKWPHMHFPYRIFFYMRAALLQNILQLFEVFRFFQHHKWNLFLKQLLWEMRISYRFQILLALQMKWLFWEISLLRGTIPRICTETLSKSHFFNFFKKNAQSTRIVDCPGNNSSLGNLLKDFTSTLSIFLKKIEKTALKN